jgi:undecaprenyl-diphosphatase
MTTSVPSRLAASPGRAGHAGSAQPPSSSGTDVPAAEHEPHEQTTGAMHPVAVVAVGAAVAYVVLALLTVGAGLLLSHVAHWHWDVIGVNDWFARRRNQLGDDVSNIGSHAAETIPVIVITTVLVVALLLRRWWQGALFIALTLVLEVTVFLTATLAVDRARPQVVHLDSSPPTSSFPSGHTAAATSLYVSAMLLLASRLRNTVARVVVFVIGALMPVYVGLSRLYRGMHHPTDVVWGVLLGTGSLAASALIVRATDRAAASRTGEKEFEQDTNDERRDAAVAK